MTEFSDIIKAIRDSAHADGPYSSVTQNVGYAVCGHCYSNTELFDEICDKLEDAHKKELEDELMKLDDDEYDEITDRMYELGIDPYA